MRRFPSCTTATERGWLHGPFPSPLRRRRQEAWLACSRFPGRSRSPEGRGARQRRRGKRSSEKSGEGSERDEIRGGKSSRTPCVARRRKAVDWLRCVSQLAG